MTNRCLCVIAFSIALLTVCVVGVVGGCIRVQRVEPGGPDAAGGQSLVADVRDAVGAYILLGGDADQRAARARRVLSIAQQVKSAAQRDVELADLRQLGIRLAMRQGSEQDRAAAMLLSNILISRVKRRLGLSIDVAVVPAELLPRTRELLISAADAVIETAGPLAAGAQAPGAQAETPSP
jgi:hypothetical protein